LGSGVTTLICSLDVVFGIELDALDALASGESTILSVTGRCRYRAVMGDSLL
jgi:hypothetical protein